MKTVSFRLVQTVKYYDWSEWKDSLDWCTDKCLGFYHLAWNEISVLVDLDGLKADSECPREYKNIPSNYWKAVLIHEYTHYLQYRKGNWKEPLCLLEEGIVPMSDRITRVYRPEDKEIEAEAVYVEQHPELLDQLEQSVIHLPDRVLSVQEETLRKQKIRVFRREDENTVWGWFDGTYCWNETTQLWEMEED